MSLDQFMPVDVTNLINGTSTLLIGGSKTFKSTLLFQASVTAASEGEKVIFIRPEPLKALPFHVHGLPKAVPSATKHIKLMYLKTAQELKNYLCKVHMDTQTLSGLLIIDDFNCYLDDYESKHTNSIYEQTSAAFSALLKDAADFCTNKRGSTCKYLVSTSTSHPSILLSGVLFYDQIWTITSKCDENYDQLWTMQSQKPKNVTVTFYKSTDDEIFLHQIKSGIELTSLECKPETSTNTES